MANSIFSAMFIDFSTVSIRTDHKAPESSVFTVRDGDGNALPIVASHSEADTVVSVKLDCEIDPKKSYTVIDESGYFAAAPIRMYRLFDTQEFGDRYNYDGVLGAEYSKAQTKFTVWSPCATAMKLNIYATGEGGEATVYDMTAGEKGTWIFTLDGNQNGKYYTYTVVNGDTEKEIVDPYARSGGKNCARGMILNLTSTNPKGWSAQNMPALDGNTSAVIWEAHVRDVTIHESSGVSEKHRGKFLGLTETGTKNKHGNPTALDYIKELGVTAVHFQPLYDFASVDENFNVATYNKEGEYNWGYDPLNYNMPEGSYSTNPSDGAVRVNELKQMIMALHNAGVQVIMDVVYNHVFSAKDSNFEALMPEYYFRRTESSEFSNGSGCGNETASERYMFRRFMIDSVKYWMTEYKIDGFRFDLMALHDTDTMNMLYAELAAINPDVIVYGEGWTASATPLPEQKRASLANAKNTPNIAYFDDVIRNALRGDNFDKHGKGYVQGVNSYCKDVYVGVYGATNNFSDSPSQNINYVCAHDDSTLWDRLNASVNMDKATLKCMNRLAATAVYTSQGIAFMLAGEEMLRSKPTKADNKYDNRPTPYITKGNYYFSDNSYRSTDSTNAIDWNLTGENSDMIDFYKALIEIKKTWRHFRLSTKKQVDSCVTVRGDTVGGVIAYAVKDPDGDTYAVVLLNNAGNAVNVSVPDGKYDVYVNGNTASADILATFDGDTFTVGARSAVVMKGELTEEAVINWIYNVNPLDDGVSLGHALELGLGIPSVMLVTDGVVFGNKKQE
ncbi:MAG: type I pullulanase [Clostridiales bacterium]|nr:type I pullulanase [Clostridiales bacterium]